MKFITIFILSLFLSNNLLAQLPSDSTGTRDKIVLRHVQGKKGFDIGYGSTKFGPVFEAGYISFMTNTVLFHPVLKYEEGKIGLTTFKQFSLFISFQRNIFNFKNVFYLNAGLAPVLHYQKSDNEILKMKEKDYPLGAAAEAELEIFITNGVVLRANCSEVFSTDHFGSPRFLAAGGLRFYFK